MKVEPRSSSFADKLQAIKINSHVSPFLHFYDEEMSKEYQKFKVAQSNTYAFIPLHIAAMFFHITGSVSGFLIGMDALNFVNVVLSIAWTVFLGNWLVAIHWKSCWFNKEKEREKGWEFLTPSYTAWLESAWIISDAICLSILLVCMANNGPCSAEQSIKQGCNYSGSENEIPMDIVMTMFFAPIIHAVVLKGASFISVLIAIGINGSTLAVTMFTYNLTFGGPIIILFCPLCLLVMYEFQRQGISVFLLSQSQAILMEEIDRLSVQTSKELRSMIGNVAHDLKTPMSAFVSGLDFISLMLDEINSKLEERGEVIKGLRSISESVINMKNINSFMRMSINRCIDYTKASNGLVLVPHMETVNFREMLQLPLSCMKNLENGKVSIELLPLSTEIAPFIITDPQWFQENVLCLLSNAVKYSAEGVVTISATLTSDTKNKNHASERLMIRIDVEDNGIGVSDDVKAHLFNPFKQAQRLAGGTGLGLYSLAKRMEAIGGLFGVESRYNGKQGSIFWFAVPYKPDDSHIAELPIVQPLPVSQNFTITSLVASPDDKKNGLNILLVDDSISILKMSEKMLSRLGHSVTTAEHGAIALKLITNSYGFAPNGITPLQRYDVVVMDLQMPIMDGLEATKRLRTFEKEKGLGYHQLIIGVSANSDHETKQAALDSGVDDFIPKPFNVKSFETVYAKLIASKK